MDKISPAISPAAAHAAELELQAQPGIAWARILEIQATEPDAAALRVAFIAGPGALREIPQALLHRHGIEHVVPVTRSGPPEQLTQLPLWSRHALERLQHSIATTSQNEADVALLALSRNAQRTVSRAVFATTASNNIDTNASQPAQVLRQEIGTRLSERDAYCDGGALILPADMPQTLAEALTATARGEAGLLYLSDTFAENRETYAALEQRALSLLSSLQAQGLRQGDHLLLDSGDARLFIATFWACILGGIVVAPIGLGDADIAARQRLLAAWQVLDRPRVAVTTAMANALAAYPEELAGLSIIDLGQLDQQAAPAKPATIRPDNIATIILTSGSTGLPKGVQQSHRSILNFIQAFVHQALGIDQRDIFLNWMPLDHVGGLVFESIAPAVLGCTQIHCPTSAILGNPALWPDLVHRHRVSVTWSPNFAFGMIADAVADAAHRPWDLSCFRWFVNGGEAVSETTLNDFLDIFAANGMPRDVICPAFGMSETCSGITYGKVGHAVGPFASLGPPVCGAALRIVDEQGNLAKEGEIGALQLRTGQIFAGYYGRPDLTQAAFHEDWFECGDVGFIAAGELYITGRLRDSININGAKFFAHEIEGIVASNPGIERVNVAAAAVRGPGASTDQAAIFFAAPLASDECDDDILRAIIAGLRASLMRELGLKADYLIPLPGSEFPRTPIGKIMRPELVKRFAAGAYDAAIERVAALVGGPERCPLPLHRRIWSAAPEPAQSSIMPGIDILLWNSATTSPPATARHALPMASDLLDDLLQSGAAAGGILVHGLHCTDTTASTNDNLIDLLHRLQRLDPAQRPARILVLTRGAFHAVPGDIPVLAQSAVAGLVRSCALLLPDIAWRVVDIAADGEAELPAIINHELALPGHEPSVAWRSQRRLVPRFRPLDLHNIASSTAALPAGDCWMIVGGLGGIGRIAARQLLARGARLLLLGRTPLAQLPPDRAAILQDLQCLGICDYVAADARDAAAMAAIVAAVESDYDTILSGILLAASDAGDTAVFDTDTALPAPAEHTLLAGLTALLPLQQTRPDLHLVVAGSIVGQLGSRMPAYAATHAAIAEHIAALQQQGHHLSLLGFSAWAGIGLSQGRTNEALLHGDGLIALDADSGWLALEAALRQPGACWLAGLNADHPLHAAYTLGSTAPLCRPVIWVAGGKRSGAMRQLDALDRPGWIFLREIGQIPRLADGSVDAARLSNPESNARVPPRDEAENRVARIFAATLGLNETDAQKLGIHDDFFAAGGSSLLATRLAAQLSQRFFVRLTVGTIFEQPTVAGLVAQLRAAEPQAGLIDAVARQLAHLEQLSPEQRAGLQAALKES